MNNLLAGKSVSFKGDVEFFANFNTLEIEEKLCSRASIVFNQDFDFTIGKLLFILYCLPKWFIDTR